MGCSLLFRRAILVEVAPWLHSSCQLVVAYGGGQITVHRYDPYSMIEEDSRIVGRSINLPIRHYYYVDTTEQGYYFYVDIQGNILEFDNSTFFDLARMSNDPSLGYGHEPIIGVLRSNPVRPTRFERILRENEIWEDYRPTPKPIQETRKTEVTEADLAAIFNKPQKLIADAPKPMDIDILKCMEEVLGKTS